VDGEASCPAEAIRHPVEIVFDDRPKLHCLVTSSIVVAEINQIRGRAS